MSKKILSALVFALMLSACVPQKQFKDMKTQKEKCEDERAKLLAQVDALETNITELKSALDAQQAAKQELLQKNEQLKNANAMLESENESLNTNLTAMRSMQDELLKGKDAETRKAMAQFQKAQTELLAREDSLRHLEQNLNEKTAKLKELQNMLDQKDASVRELKKKVTDALVGFNGNGLTIEQKNGKIYVTLDRKSTRLNSSHVSESRMPSSA